MENETCKKKTTAPDTSVGADDGQPLHNSTENSISAFEEEINGDFQNSSESLDEIYRRMQRLTDPHYLHTISMTELYQTAYQRAAHYRRLALRGRVHSRRRAEDRQIISGGADRLSCQHWQGVVEL